MFDLYKTKEQLQKLQKLPDLDTVCAFDYYKMKTYAMEGDGLKYQDFHPEIKGVTVPKMEWTQSYQLENKQMATWLILFKLIFNTNWLIYAISPYTRSGFVLGKVDSIFKFIWSNL